jgi:6-phosphogluconolactonase
MVGTGRITMQTSTGPIIQYLLYAGGYTDRGGQGIYGYKFSSVSGSLEPLGLIAKAVNPSYLLVNSAKSVLYAVNEIDSFQGRSTGSIQAYKILEGTGKLTLLSEISSHGAAPCFLALDEVRGYLFTANYRGGNIAAFRLSSDGDIAEMSSSVEHRGVGFHANRQTAPHPHAIELSSNGARLIVADLGLDRIQAYEFDAVKGSISSETSWSVSVHDGAGPRHLAMSHDGQYLYVVNEIDSSVTAFVCTVKSASPKAIQTVGTLPQGFSGHNDAADICLSGDGRFLYVSNRGADNIQVFAVNHDNGTLEALSACSSGGKTPLSFRFSEDERFLMVANQGSDRITVLERNTENGALNEIGISETMSSPASIAIFPLTQ